MGREELFKIAITENPTLLLQVWLIDWSLLGLNMVLQMNLEIHPFLLDFSNLMGYRFLKYSLITFWISLMSIAMFPYSIVILFIWLSLSSFWLVEPRVCPSCSSSHRTSSQRARLLVSSKQAHSSHGSGKSSEDSPVQHLLLKESGIQTTW